ncbi:MAG: neutral/alkaline non-lysosomal ceramidase N-terminal domain-containing protein [Pirellulaceae bacterium]|nr:neutral/alkaline non-lysosomal ceramidase N-terminal domain-containing protein [Pirellulaceae bacterium]
MSKTPSIRICWIACLFFVASTTGLLAAEPAGWQAGIARVEITPKQWMWMAGYGSRNRPADGKLTDLYAKALVLQDAEGQRIALVTLDLIGTDRGLMQAVCRQITDRYGLKREQIALCSSHTHSGPALAGNLSPLHYLVVDRQQQELIEQYTAKLQEQLVQLVGTAIDRITPAKLAWGNGRATFAVNRRNNRPEDAIEQLRAEGRLVGPSDHDVPVLAVRDNAGELKAAVFGYACHATVLSSYQWCGDYPGYAQSEIEREFPDCQAMFWAGCGGDQNPLPRRTVELAQGYGRQLADAVQRILMGEMQPIAPSVMARYREIDLPLAELPTREQIQTDAGSDNHFVAARGKMLLEQLARSGQLSKTYPYPVQTWRLGEDIQFVILGGEVVVDFAVRLKSELRGPRTWVAGYANDVMAYIASRRVLAEGGYEGASAMLYYGLPTGWAPESEDLIVHEVHRQLDQHND